LARRWPPKAQSVFVRHEGGVSYLKLRRLLEGTIIKSAKIVHRLRPGENILYLVGGEKARPLPALSSTAHGEL
jgi:hypothetical protein